MLSIMEGKMTNFKTIKIVKGRGGFGGPLVLKPTEEKKYVISVTGGGIDPVAQKIADLSGAIAVDQFKNPVDKSETFVAVIDCGGNSRVGTYPRLGIPTVDIKMQGPAGPLAKFITEDIFVSGVKPTDISIVDDVLADVEEVVAEEKEPAKETKAESHEAPRVENKPEKVGGIRGIIDKVGRAAGNFTTLFLSLIHI